MNSRDREFLEQLHKHFGEVITNSTVDADMISLDVPAEHWFSTAHALRDDFNFEQLTDLCGVDYLGYGEAEWQTEDVSGEGFSRGVDCLGPGRFAWQQAPQADGDERRFAVVAHVLSIRFNRRLRLRSLLPAEAMPRIASLVEVWSVANWYEREVFDLFGIVFEEHPDLRRILTDYGFIGHPFRKDFPLVGNVEVRYDPEKRRVVYEPVSIEPRVLVPRVIRDDSRYADRNETQGGDGNRG